MKGIWVTGTYLLLHTLLHQGFSQTLSYREPVARPEPYEQNCSIAVPNAFTPNGDGINDALELRCDCQLSEFSFEVYSRNGNQVYRSRQIRQKWNGTQSGRPVKEGYYNWEITYKASDTGQYTRLRGNIAIIRS